MVNEMAQPACACLASVIRQFTLSRTPSSMSHPHLVHKLPWVDLGRVVKRVATPLPGNPKFRLHADEAKVVEHFAKCLVSTITEFAATDKSSADVKKHFDPEQACPWSIVVQAHPNYHYPGYLTTIIHSYIGFNLILLDPDVFVPLVMVDDDRPSSLMEYAFETSKGHPVWLVDQLQQAFYSDKTARGFIRLKPVTTEVLDILREQCKHLFRCLYTCSGENAVRDWEVVHSSMAIDSFRKRYPTK